MDNEKIMASARKFRKLLRELEVAGIDPHEYRASIPEDFLGPSGRVVTVAHARRLADLIDNPHKLERHRSQARAHHQRNGGDRLVVFRNLWDGMTPGEKTAALRWIIRGHEEVA